MCKCRTTTHYHANSPLPFSPIHLRGRPGFHLPPMRDISEQHTNNSSSSCCPESKRAMCACSRIPHLTSSGISATQSFAIWPSRPHLQHTPSLSFVFPQSYSSDSLP